VALPATRAFPVEGVTVPGPVAVKLTVPLSEPLEVVTIAVKLAAVPTLLGSGVPVPSVVVVGMSWMVSLNTGEVLLL
jgi:hypothetical protein